MPLGTPAPRSVPYRQCVHLPLRPAQSPLPLRPLPEWEGGRKEGGGARGARQRTRRHANGARAPQPISICAPPPTGATTFSIVTREEMGLNLRSSTVAVPRGNV